MSNNKKHYGKGSQRNGSQLNEMWIEYLGEQTFWKKIKLKQKVINIYRN